MATAVALKAVGSDLKSAFITDAIDPTHRAALSVTYTISSTVTPVATEAAIKAAVGGPVATYAAQGLFLGIYAYRNIASSGVANKYCVWIRNPATMGNIAIPGDIRWVNCSTTTQPTSSPPTTFMKARQASRASCSRARPSTVS